MYSNNDTKAAQTGGGLSVLQMLLLLIVHTTNVLAGDTRRYLDVTIADVAVVFSPSLNSLSMLMYKSRAKE